MMCLGFLHTPLPIRVIEEFKRFVERLRRIIQNVGECSTLSIFQEFFARDGNFDHSRLSLTPGNNGITNIVIANTATTNIVAA
jgi:hypothetical protein